MSKLKLKYNESDILTIGYIRFHIELKYNIVIPSGIQQICFEYCGPFLSDVWYEKDDILKTTDGYHPVEIIDNRAVFDGSYALFTFFGTKIVNNGVYTWRLRLNDIRYQGNEHMPYIGIIDSSERLRKNNETNSLHKFGYTICGGKGIARNKLLEDRFIDGLFFKDKGDVLEITLNLDKLTISAESNKKDCGVIFKDISPGSYCLAVNISLSKQAEVELL